MSKRINPLKELKQIYHKQLIKAQRKFRKEKKAKSGSISFLEAERSGGQFSFAKIKTAPEFYRELTRINTYLNIELTEPETFIQQARERGEDYVSLFERGISMEERYERGLNADLADLYAAYRMLQEEDPAAIMRGGIFDSDSFIAYLYSYKVQGYDRDQMRQKGHDLIEEIRNLRREKFSTDIPVSQFNRGGV